MTVTHCPSKLNDTSHHDDKHGWNGEGGWQDMVHKRSPCAQGTPCTVRGTHVRNATQLQYHQLPRYVKCMVPLWIVASHISGCPAARRSCSTCRMARRFSRVMRASPQIRSSSSDWPRGPCRTKLSWHVRSLRSMRNTAAREKLRPCGVGIALKLVRSGHSSSHHRCGRVGSGATGLRAEVAGPASDALPLLAAGPTSDADSRRCWRDAAGGGRCDLERLRAGPATSAPR